MDTGTCAGAGENAARCLLYCANSRVKSAAGVFSSSNLADSTKLRFSPRILLSKSSDLVVVAKGFVGRPAKRFPSAGTVRPSCRKR